MDPPLTQPAAGGSPQGKTMPWYVSVLLVGFVVVLFASLFGFATYMAVRQDAQKKAEEAAFQPVIKDFLFAPVKPGPGEPRPRLGKVVLVDADKQAFDPLHLTLPEDLRALTPEEATTVGQIRYSRKEVGHYQGKQRAIQLSCTLTVVDRVTRKIIAKETFSWGPPPVRVPSSGSPEDVVGDSPWKEITRFLSGLR